MPNLTSGLVVRNASAPPIAPFYPTGYAFRNTSATKVGITHVVVVDTTTMMSEDRLTRCNVTVMPPQTADATNAAQANAVWQPLRIWLTNGTVFDATPVSPHTPNQVFPADATAPISFALELFDAPTLVARSDALPTIELLYHN